MCTRELFLIRVLPDGRLVFVAPDEHLTETATSLERTNTTNNPTGPVSGTARILRGGCWGSNADSSRVAFRTRASLGSLGDGWIFLLSRVNPLKYLNWRYDSYHAGQDAACPKQS